MNAWRVGYGSDTEGPEQYRVTANTTTTKERAKANLLKRIPEYMGRARRAVTGPVWDKLNANQHAALCSLAYNTGSVRIRIFPEDPQKTAGELASLAPPQSLPSGVRAALRKRRAKEAQVYLRPVDTPAHVPPAVGGAGTAAISVYYYFAAHPQFAIGAIAIAVALWCVALFLMRRKKPEAPQTAGQRLQAHMQELAALQQLVVEDRLEVQKERDALNELLSGESHGSSGDN